MNKKRTAKAVLAAFGLSIALPTAALAATDVNGHWAEDVLNKWEQNGMLAGYEDGTIRPEQPITRAEFTALVNRVTGYNAVDKEIAFTDVSANDWYASEVAIGVNAAYIGGYPDNTFRPNGNLTRAEAASMIARFTGLTADEARAALFDDAAEHPDWAEGAIGAVANAGYMIGDEYNHFHAQKVMTRAETVAALDRIFFAEKALEASLSSTNGTVFKGNSIRVTVNTAVKDAVIKAVSTNEKAASVKVEGNQLVITGVESGNATIAVVVSAPGYAAAKLTYSVHVTDAVGGFSGGGSTDDSTVTVTTPLDQITVPAGYSKDGISIRTVVYKYGIDDAHDEIKDAITYVTLPSALKVSQVTLPAGSSFTTTIGGKTYNMVLTADLVKSSVSNITVAEVKAVIDNTTDAWQALATLDENRVLIECMQDSDGNLHWYIDGKTWNEQVDVFEFLEVTLAEK